MSCFICVSCDELLLIDLHTIVAIKSDCRCTMAFGWVKIVWSALCSCNTGCNGPWLSKEPLCTRAKKKVRMFHFLIPFFAGDVTSLEGRMSVEDGGGADAVSPNLFWQ